MTRFSRKAAVPRDSLYRMFAGEVSPAFETVMKLLMALDIQMIAKPVVAPKPQANP
jgi:DNA-binding phage protein